MRILISFDSDALSVNDWKRLPFLLKIDVPSLLLNSDLIGLDVVEAPKVFLKNINRLLSGQRSSLHPISISNSNYCIYYYVRFDLLIISQNLSRTLLFYRNWWNFIKITGFYGVVAIWNVKTDATWSENISTPSNIKLHSL